MLKKGILFSTFFLYGLSLSQICYCVSADCTGRGIIFLIFGLIYLPMQLMALLEGNIQLVLSSISWLGNPLLFISIILLRKNKLKRASNFALFSVFFMSLFWIFALVIDDVTGTVKEVTSFKAGYFFWLSSAIVLFMGTLLLRLNNNGFFKDTSASKNNK